jgi:hypothetical protein
MFCTSSKFSTAVKSTRLENKYDLILVKQRYITWCSTVNGASGAVVGSSIAPQDGKFGVRFQVEYLEIFKRPVRSVRIQ